MVELMVVICIIIIGIVVFYGLVFKLIYHFVWKGLLEPFFFRADYVLEAKNIADTLGNSDREGYGNKNWDNYDQKALCEAMKVPRNTSIEDISSKNIKLFVVANRSQ